eukprot:TRINITY_DN6014_c0_g1_i7.p1 TRINITY_DN6014_c0_g1~~TRINITY_DN6014_c0_g1_i7.p1  ORF type:complete len:373 (+),score=78.45 TRINITY_DN6014_c0_g1_i7:1090-2208(+)
MWLLRLFEKVVGLDDVSTHSTILFPSLVSVHTNFIEFRHPAEGPLSDPVRVYPLNQIQSVCRLSAPSIGFSLRFVTASPKEDNLTIWLQDNQLSDVEYLAWCRALSRFHPDLPSGELQEVNPPILVHCARRCLQQIADCGGHKLEGIFRLTGDIALVDNIFKQIVLHEEDEKDPWSLVQRFPSMVLDAHNLSSLFRRLVREMPVSILGPQSSINEFLKVQSNSSVEDVKLLLLKLSASSRLILFDILRACKEVTANGETTLMDPAKIGRCIGPNINFYKVTSDLNSLKDFSPLFEFLTDHIDELFPESSVREYEQLFQTNSRQRQEALSKVVATFSSVDMPTLSRSSSFGDGRLLWGALFFVIAALMWVKFK